MVALLFYLSDMFRVKQVPKALILLVHVMALQPGAESPVFELLGQDRSLVLPFRNNHGIPAHPACDSGSMIRGYLSGRRETVLREPAYPESLDFWDQSFSAGAYARLGTGNYGLIVNQWVSRNQAIVISITDSTDFRAKTDFSNRRESATFTFENRLLGKRLWLGGAASAVFWNTPHQLAGISQYLDVDRLAFVGYCRHDSSFVRFSCGQQFIDKNIQASVLGLAIQAKWLPGMVVGNAFTFRMRNYWRKDFAEIDWKHAWGKAKYASGRLQVERGRPQVIFPLDEWMQFDYTSLRGTIRCGWRLGPWIRPEIELAGSRNENEFTAYYQRGNGSYSTMLKDGHIASALGSFSLTNHCEIAQNHKVSTRLRYRTRQSKTPEIFRFDPTKYLGFTYGTKRVNFDFASRTPSAGMAYSWHPPSQEFQVALTGIWERPAGEIISESSFLSEIDTIRFPVTGIQSLQVEFNYARRFWRHCKIRFGGYRLFPYGVDIHPDFQKEPPPPGEPPAEAPPRQRRITALSRFAATVCYGF